MKMRTALDTERDQFLEKRLASMRAENARLREQVTHERQRAALAEESRRAAFELAAWGGPRHT